MTLPDPCEGESAGFHMLPAESYQGTLGDPEKIIWSSIRHLCVPEVAHSILVGTHKIQSQKSLKEIIPNIKVYITQASKFYDAAQHATTDTAPLLYYYSFLNLAKVLCEIRQPRFHKRPESYRHGLSWKPSADFLVYMEKETIYATTRGVWHVLLDALEGQPPRVPNPMTFRIKDLFALCPNTTVEYEATYHQPTRLIELIDPDILFGQKNSELEYGDVHEMMIFFFAGYPRWYWAESLAYGNHE